METFSVARDEEITDQRTEQEKTTNKEGNLLKNEEKKSSDKRQDYNLKSKNWKRKQFEESMLHWKWNFQSWKQENSTERSKIGCTFE